MNLNFLFSDEMFDVSYRMYLLIEQKVQERVVFGFSGMISGRRREERKIDESQEKKKKKTKKSELTDR